MGTRSFAGWLVLALAVCALVASCGRSNLDAYTHVDGGPTFDGGVDGSEGGGCDALSCPSGCCDANGQCQAGNSFTACGNLGASCANCQALGFQLCDPQQKACANKPGNCDAKTCAGGCCDRGLCFQGSDPNECGNFGAQCQHCAAQGQTCQGKQCVTQMKCGPGNCPGCCFGDACLMGFDNTACGGNGQQCRNCLALNESCVPGPGGGVCVSMPTCDFNTCPGGCCDQFGQCSPGTSDFSCGLKGLRCQNCAQLNESCVGQQCQPQIQCNAQTCPGGCCQGNVCMGGGNNNACGFGGNQCKDCTLGGLVCNGMGACVPPPPLCNPQTCPSGCCTGNVCAVGTQDTSCGTGGAQCQNCQAMMETCKGQTCVPIVTTCTPQNCAGCCDAQGTCQPGFLNGQCGQNGAACVNCSAQGTTCDTAVMPRVCTNQQTTCPAPYNSCPNGVSTAIPPVQRGACTGSDLANARSACAGGAHTNGCASFFAFEQQQRPACAACLRTFDSDFQEATGLFACVAPFVSQSCDHTTGCATDCDTKSCAMCDPGSVSQCQATVRQGQCGQFYQQAACVFPAFMGAGSFCNPQNYGGNFGAWLQGVGGHYCGP